MSTECHVLEVQNEKFFLMLLKKGRPVPTIETKITRFEGEVPLIHSMIAISCVDTNRVDYYRVIYHLSYLTRKEDGDTNLKCVFIYVVKVSS
jgi:hypothetical protein